MVEAPVARGPTHNNTPCEILEQPLGTVRHVRIVTIGAGASGLNMILLLSGL